MKRYLFTFVLFFFALIILSCDGFNMKNKFSFKNSEIEEEQIDSLSAEPTVDTGANGPLQKGKGIPMKKKNGVYMIPCKVNSIPLEFIFDTGAATVVISITEAEFMYKNGHLLDSDIISESQYTVANGEIVTGMNITLKEVEIGPVTLKNVEATVMNNTSAPLLLGQSALKRLGGISFDYETNQLFIGQ